MAKPIEPTPSLHGESADALLDSLNSSASPEEMQRRTKMAREVINYVMTPVAERKTMQSFSDLLKDPNIQKLVVERTIREANASVLWADPFLPPPKPLTRWERVYYGTRNWLRDVRLRIGSWIAGVDLDDDERW